MRTIATRTARTAPVPKSVTDWRLSDEAFFWKFCEPTRIKDSQGALTHGITLKRPHFEHFLSLPESANGKTGRRVGYENCHRYLTNSQFVKLASDGWIGGGRRASAMIRSLLRATEIGGRRAMLAVIQSSESIDVRTQGLKTR
jgi:hypothetical protein